MRLIQNIIFENNFLDNNLLGWWCRAAGETDEGAAGDAPEEHGPAPGVPETAPGGEGER